MGIDPDVQVILEAMQAEIDALKAQPPGSGRQAVKQVLTYQNADGTTTDEVWEITP